MTFVLGTATLMTIINFNAYFATLSAIEQRLDPKRFVRVHRSFIVNIGLIVEMKTTRFGNYLVVLRDGGEVPMSRTFKEAVLNALQH